MKLEARKPTTNSHWPALKVIKGWIDMTAYVWRVFRVLVEKAKLVMRRLPPQSFGNSHSPIWTSELLCQARFAHINHTEFDHHLQTTRPRQFEMADTNPTTQKFGKGERSIPHHSQKASKYYPAHDVAVLKKVRYRPWQQAGTGVTLFLRASHHSTYSGIVLPWTQCSHLVAQAALGEPS